MNQAGGDDAMPRRNVGRFAGTPDERELDPRLARRERIPADRQAPGGQTAHALNEPFVPEPGARGRVARFLFRLETVDGAPADPATVSVAVPNWRAGDTLHTRGKTLRVVGKRDDDADQPPVLIVEQEH